jgi:CheY-like chemotaxis protein
MNAAASHAFESRNTVLLVEDDHEIRVSVRNLLEDEGYCVLTASDGRSAIAVLERCDIKPCLILLDLMLPVMDGWHFAERLRLDPALSDIPIAVVSAFDEPPPPPGIVGFLRKPVRDDMLLELVGAYCE